MEWRKLLSCLDLCQHHSREYGPALVAAGWRANEHIGEESDLRPGAPLASHGA
ncbi:hypothetical protein GCM10027053_23730 [Intrasporangium mesophilum]